MAEIVCLIGESNDTQEKSYDFLILKCVFIVKSI